MSDDGPRASIDELEAALGALACAYRRARQRADAHAEVAAITERYHAALGELMTRPGWIGSLDVDAELPDRHMPAAYLNRFAELERGDQG
ncbi:hypothetical protein [Haliangium ochraceum]|uniref:Uncharacterized protein n=1 Tax=Haliangium ochraceum (strain DSM 14365 / JCM 11303 / SMP-2) TaxID=502025 RepID=D0LSC2_HALO1|nr:hypothetical protein [Haliangium ochraceum]ACY15621.1 hypothetical protein Hoch_3119 [Haliangium ochraceum DSM 14365]